MRVSGAATARPEYFSSPRSRGWHKAFKRAQLLIPPFGNNDIISRRGIRDTFSQRANITSHLDARLFDMSGVQHLLKIFACDVSWQWAGCRGRIVCIIGNLVVKVLAYRSAIKVGNGVREEGLPHLLCWSLIFL